MIYALLMRSPASHGWRVEWSTETSFSPRLDPSSRLKLPSRKTAKATSIRNSNEKSPREKWIFNDKKMSHMHTPLTTVRASFSLVLFAWVFRLEAQELPTKVENVNRKKSHAKGEAKPRRAESLHLVIYLRCRQAVESMKGMAKKAKKSARVVDFCAHIRWHHTHSLCAHVICI
jgi:hypothetical protein